MGLQTSVNIASPVGTEGAKASSNPCAAVIGVNGSLVADPVNGLNVGRFAWVSTLGAILTNYAPGGVPAVPDGFIMLEMQANNANLLAPTGINIQPGTQSTAFNRGDFYARCGFANAVRGNKVFANMFSGAVVPGAAGSFPNYPAGASTTFTGWISAASPAILTVTAVTGTPLGVGTLITGPGVPINTRIASFGTGTGGTGTYNLSTPNVVPSFTAQASLATTVMTVVSANGPILVGQSVTGTGIPTGTTIASFGTGTGGAGTYNLSASCTTEPTETVTIGGVVSTVLTCVAADGIGGATVTATFATNVMTVTAVTDGTLVPGQLLTDSTAGLAAGTYIVNQLTGTTGGIGTYTVSTTPGTLATGTVNASAWIETPFFFQTPANVGELAIIGTRN
jgi:hypothetical protein